MLSVRYLSLSCFSYEVTMILLKPLLLDIEKAWHQENYLINSGGKVLSQDYLEASNNFFFRSLFGKKVLGGVSINTEGPFRVEKALGHPLENRDRYLEISGLWIAKKSRNAAVKTLVMFGLMLVAKRFGDREIIAYTTHDRLWTKLYSRLGAELLYQGPLQGIPNLPNGYVFSLSTYSVYSRWPSYLLNRRSHS